MALRIDMNNLSRTVIFGGAALAVLIVVNDAVSASGAPDAEAVAIQNAINGRNSPTPEQSATNINPTRETVINGATYRLAGPTSVEVKTGSITYVFDYASNMVVVDGPDKADHVMSYGSLPEDYYWDLAKEYGCTLTNTRGVQQTAALRTFKQDVCMG